MKWIHSVLRYAFVLLICYAGGIVLLCLAYLIPTGPIRTHLAESAQVFEAEGVYPALSTKTASTLDNFTDSKMLLTAGYDGNEPLIERVVMGYSNRLRSVSPVETFIHEYDPQSFPTDEETAISNYSRYWQGYLVVLKPMLTFFNYSQIRVVNGVAQFVLVVALIIQLRRKGLDHLIIPLLLAVATIAPVAVSRSLQFSTVYYLALAGCLVAVSKGGTWLRSTGSSSLFHYFFLMGALTSYFDFLTYPLVVLGFPLVVVLNLREGEVKRRPFHLLVGLCVLWGAGYVLMWGGKWLIGALLLGDMGIIADALNQVSYRSSIGEAEGNPLPEGYSVLMAVAGNVKTYLSWLTVRLLGLVFVIYALLIVFRVWRRREWGAIALLARRNAMLLLVALLPFCWYLVIGNHSFVHAFFTYRILAISTFAVFSLFSGLLMGPEKACCAEKSDSDIGCIGEGAE